VKPKTRRSDQEVAGLGHQKSHNMEDQGDPDGQRQQAGCGDQGGEPGDIGHLNSQWEHHGQEGDHQAQVDQEEIYGADQGQESEKSYKGPKSKEGNLRSHSNPNMTQRKRVAKEENHMKHMMKRDNEEMTKRMDDHNHMMRKDSVKKVEKKKTKATKVPLLMGLGLPVLRKRFLNSFQDEWADYASWGIDKRSGEYLDFELESEKENFEPSTKKKRRLGSEKKRSWPLL